MLHRKPESPVRLLHHMPSTPQVVLLMVPFAGFDRGLLDGIARYAQLHGPWVFFLSGDDPRLPLPASDSVTGNATNLAGASQMLNMLPLPDLVRWGATGVIGRIHTRRIATRIAKAGIPVIAIDRSDELSKPDSPIANVSQIRAESHRAGIMAAEHFLDRGFRSFAFCGYEGRHWSRGRQEGFCERLALAGAECQVYEPAHLRPPLRRHEAVSWEQEQPLVVAWLRSLRTPVAIMACNDIRGRQVVEAAHQARLLVPDDVAVVGVDDDRLVCSLSNPPLSSVALNLEQAGYQAAGLLDDLMRQTVARPQIIPAEPLRVVARRSTDVIATEDPQVATALRFIRDHARQPIGVRDVAEQAGASRRSLEIHFRRVLGRSVHDEIQRVRLEHAKQLLLETDLPAERIAELIGFSSLAYLSNVFRRQVGKKLSEFRRREVRL